YFYKSPWQVIPSVAPTVGNIVKEFRDYESPKIAFNFNKTWGYLKPSLELPISYYKLKKKTTDINKFKNRKVTRVLPIFNIDA
ncbi:LPS-assembly protein LptD, partial [Francisella tularensis subsp. holarctica]|uniref:LPS assembly protein LptD n=1 Tax=Francisella tularensis TaxID=263 RepID=UPI002381CB1E